MVEHGRPFDMILPTAPDLPLDETREIVPAEAVWDKLVEMTAPYLGAIPRLCRVATGPVIHLEPPPPIADNAVIAPLVPWFYYPGQPQIVAPKWVRYKVWLMHCQVIAATCAKLGVPVARAPEEAKDAEGFLHPAFDEDGAHANAAYGALVLECLRRSPAIP